LTRSLPGSSFCPYAPGVGTGLPQAEASRARTNSVMQLKTSDLQREFIAASKSGRLGVDSLMAVLAKLGVHLPRSISFSEFLRNRAAFATLQLPASCGKRTLCPGKNQMNGVPPRRVANATYSGSDADLAISQQIVKDNAKYIRAPGIAESQWAIFRSFQEDHPEKVKLRKTQHKTKCDALHQARKASLPGYQGYFPMDWYDDQGRIAPPKFSSPRVTVRRAPQTAPIGRKRTKRAAEKDAARRPSTREGVREVNEDRLKIFPECLPTRVGYGDSMQTTALSSWGHLDYRRKSVRNARGKPFLGATKPSIYIG